MLSLRPCSDEVIRIEALYQFRLLVYPFHEFLLMERIIDKATWFVGYFPSHQRLAVLIWLSGVSVCPHHHLANVLISQSLCFVVDDEIGDILHILPPSVDARHWRLIEVFHLSCAVGTLHIAFESYPVEVSSVASRPFPSIIEIENGSHISFLQLHHEEVESCQYGVIIYSWG